MSQKLSLRIIGLCILAAFPLYGIGQGMLSGPSANLGIILVLANSVAVVTIGILLRPIIALTAPATANIYLVTRMVEGLLLALGAIVVFAGGYGPLGGDDYYHLAMAALGLGSLAMCRWLTTSGLVPKFVAWAGFWGYVALVLAMVAADRGFETASMMLLVPGLLFEVTFAIYLLIQPGRRAVAI